LLYEGERNAVKRKRSVPLSKSEVRLSKERSDTPSQRIKGQFPLTDQEGNNAYDYRYIFLVS